MIDFFGQQELFVEYQDEYLSIFKDSLLHDTLLRGRAINYLEEKLAGEIGTEFAIAVNSGTDALLIALTALGVGYGDEVIVPAFSFVASATPVKILGAIPVFVDIDCLGFIDSSKIQQAITKRTKGIIVVDLFGELCDYSEIRSICTKNKLFLLEDAAQAYGSAYRNQLAGSFGDIGTMSFDVSKVVYGISTGGVIFTNDKNTFMKAQMLRGHGFNSGTRNFEQIGYNSNMSSLNAAILSYRLDLDKKLRLERIRCREFYDNYLRSIRGLKLLERNSDSLGNNHKYVIFVDNRDELISYLSMHSIPTKIHYERPIPHYGNFGICCSFPVAEKFAAKILSLPIHPHLKHEDLSYICKHIRCFYE